jgi:hypothetical protein
MGAVGQWIGLVWNQSFLIQPGAVDAAQVEDLVTISRPPDDNMPPGYAQAVTGEGS